MDVELSAEQEALRASTRGVLERLAPTTWVREHADTPAGDTADVWSALVHLGIVGLLVPERNGGTGGTTVDAGVVLEELGRGVHPGPYLPTAVTAATLARATGSAGLLERIAAGARVATPYPDPTRPMPAGLELTGSGTVSGAVPWVAEALGCTTAVLPASGPDGPAIVEVALDEVEPVATTDLTRRFATVTADATGATVLASGTEAEVAWRRAGDRTALALACDGVGCADRALEIAVAYGHDRHQFGVPIGSFQAVQHLCADMLRAVELTRVATYYALWAADEADDAEAHRAAVAAKAQASRALPFVGEQTIQVLGGIGFTWEHDAHLHLKRLLTMEHAAGGADDHLDELARLVVD